MPDPIQLKRFFQRIQVAVGHQVRHASCLSLGGRPVLKQPTAWPIFSVTLCESDSLA